MPEPALCCRVQDGYRDRCDLLVGLPGLHVRAVEQDRHDLLVVTVDSARWASRAQASPAS